MSNYLFCFGWNDACERYESGMTCVQIEQDSRFGPVGSGQRAAIHAIRGFIMIATRLAKEAGLSDGKIEQLIERSLEV